MSDDKTTNTNTTNLTNTNPTPEQQREYLASIPVREPSAGDSAGEGCALLSFADLKAGGDKPYTRVETDIVKDGKRGVVFVREPTARIVMMMGDLKSLDSDARFRVFCDVVSSVTYASRGQLLFTNDGGDHPAPDQVCDAPTSVFRAVMEEVTRRCGVEHEVRVNANATNLQDVVEVVEATETEGGNTPTANPTN